MKMEGNYNVRGAMDRFETMEVTPESVKEEVSGMAQYAGEENWPRNAELHPVEDELHLTVLRAIANGTVKDIETARAVCKEAIATDDLVFSRWYD